MQTFKNVLDPLLTVWNESTAAARLGILLLLAICVGAIVGVGIWSAQPNYVRLAENLDHVKSTQLMAGLDQANIAYQIKGAGSIILVDERNFDRASIIAGSRGINPAHVELETASPWVDPASQQNIFRRNLERQLSASIQQYVSVDSATVHLSLPERQPFLRQSSQPTAAVILKIAANHRFYENQAVAIAELVASAVPGLSPDQVKITDTAGNLYSHNEDLGRLTKQEEFRINRERELAQKAQSLLINFLGVSNSRVEVTTDFSFPEGRTTTKEYDPDKRVLTSEIIDSSTSTGATGSPIGVAGTTSNLSNSRGGSNPRSQNTKSETINATYEVSSTMREDIVRTPVMNMMTVSVLVNANKVTNDNQEIPASVRQSIEGLVKQAVGFRDGVDQFNLEFFEFVELLPADAPIGVWFPWDQIQSLIKNLSLGIAAIIALVIGSRTLSQLKPSPAPDQAPAAANRDSQLSQLSEMVQSNPEIFSRILASWASQEDQDQSEEQSEESSTPVVRKAG